MIQELTLNALKTMLERQQGIYEQLVLDYSKGSNTKLEQEVYTHTHVLCASSQYTTSIYTKIDNYSWISSLIKCVFFSMKVYIIEPCTVHVLYMCSTCAVHVQYIYCTCAVHVLLLPTCVY